MAETSALTGRQLLDAVRDVVYDLPAFARVFGVILMEFGDFAMQRRMLRGIKARAEAHRDDARSRDETRLGVSAPLGGELR